MVVSYDKLLKLFFGNTKMSNVAGITFQTLSRNDGDVIASVPDRERSGQT